MALMIQSYLVTEDDRARLNSNQEDFDYIVTSLESAIADRQQHDIVYYIGTFTEVQRHRMLVGDMSP